MTRLNLGAGSKARRGWVNVDRVPLPGITTVYDLDTPYQWPWENGSVSAIEADNVFEHLAEPVKFMTECHRVLQPRGTLHILTPHFSSRASWDDPTHVRHCTPWSWDFWIPGTEHFEASNAAYGAVSYERVSIEARQDGMIDVTLRKPPTSRPAPGFPSSV